MEKKKTQWETIKRVLKYTKKYNMYIAFSLILAAVTVVLTLYLPILTGDAVDLMLGKSAVKFAGLMVILKKMIVIIAFTALAQWLMNICNNKITYNVVRDIRKDAFEKIQILPLKYIDGHPSGDVVSRVIADADQFADGLLMGFTQAFTGVLTILGTLVFMLSLNVWITLVVVIVTPLSFFVASFIAKRTYTMFKLQSATRGEQTALIDEMVGNQKVVQAYGHEKEALEKFDDINRRLQKYSLQATFFSSITNPATRFVNNIVYAGVGVTGAFFALNGYLSVGMLSCFLGYANQYTKPFNEISGVVTELQNAIACAARVLELIDEEPQIPEDSDAVELSDVKGEVELSSVYFSYVEDKKLITDFNLNVKPGQRVAIVGPTGAGKTTIVNLLSRFYNVDSGEVLIDGIDISKVKIHSLRTQMGVMMQDSFIFSGTIMDNIRYGNKTATDEEVIRAAKTVCAHDFIMEMEEGYNTQVNERGSRLSVGQRQLISFARALLANPAILILDEATSSIDTETEIVLQEGLNNLLKGRTSFIIAHRLSTIKNADKIMYIDKGGILEAGSHDELLENKGAYYDLYMSQYL